MTKQTEVLLHVLLCLLINMSSKKSVNSEMYSEKVIQNTILFVDIERDAALKLIGNLIQIDSKNAKNFQFFDNNFVLKMVDNIKVDLSRDQSLKMLALCTTFSEDYCEKLLEIDYCKKANFFN